MPTDLPRLVREGRCVLFAGAGLSAQAATEEGIHLPLWGELLEQMVDWCIEHRVELRANKTDFVEILRKKRFLPVAQELQEALGPELGICISNVLRVRAVRPSQAHTLLPNSNCVAVLTSNYDGLIEGAYALARGGIVPPVYTRRSIGQALNSFRNGEFFLFKVHGDVNQPDSLILGDRDYSRLLYLDPSYRSFLETVFATYTVLFVGFGTEDPDLTAVIDRLSAVYERSVGKHYILVPEDTFSAMERRRLLEDKRLDCITYIKDQAHSQLVEFLKAIASLSRQPESMESPFPLRDVKLRVFISGSYDDRQLLKQIAEITKEPDYAPWLAAQDITPGGGVPERVSRAIADCDCMIIVISDRSAQSPWIEFEAQRAFAARKTILPIRVGEATIPSDLADLTYLQLDTPNLTPQDRVKFTDALRTIADRIRRDVSEKELIKEALEASRGNITKAAAILGYKSRQTILSKMDRYGIPRNYFDFEVPNPNI